MKNKILSCKTVGDLRNLNLENATEFEKKTVEFLKESFDESYYKIEDKELLKNLEESLEYIAVGKSQDGKYYFNYPKDGCCISVKEVFDFIAEGSLDSANSWWNESHTDKDEEEYD